MLTLAGAETSLSAKEPPVSPPDTDGENEAEQVGQGVAQPQIPAHEPEASSPRAWLDAEYERLQQSLADLDRRAPDAAARLAELKKLPFGDEYLREANACRASFPGISAAEMLDSTIPDPPTAAGIRATVKKALASMKAEAKCFAAP